MTGLHEDWDLYSKAGFVARVLVEAATGVEHHPDTIIDALADLDLERRAYADRHDCSYSSALSMYCARIGRPIPDDLWAKVGD